MGADLGKLLDRAETNVLLAHEIALLTLITEKDMEMSEASSHREQEQQHCNATSLDGMPGLLTIPMVHFISPKLENVKTDRIVSEGDRR